MKTVLAVIILSVFSTAAQAQHLVEKPSPFDVKTTIDRLVVEIRKEGGGVLGRVNHSDIAAGASLPLRPNVVLIFGAPNWGTPLMQSGPRIGLELPLRISAYEDENGRVKVIHQNFTQLAEIYGVTDPAAVTTVIGILDRITAATTTDTTNAAIND